MTIAPFDLVLLLGSLQGFILAGLLWLNRNGNPLSNRLLAVLIGLLALMSLATSIPLTNRWIDLAVTYLPLVMAMPIGPLLYFYARSVLDPAFRLGNRERLQFYTVILDWGACLIVWIFMAGVFLGVLPAKEGPRWAQLMNTYNIYVDIPRWISVTVYLVLTRRLLLNHPALASPSAVEQQRRRWLSQFMLAFLAFQAIWLAHLVPYIVPAWRGPLMARFGYYPIYVPIAILIYWLGLRGYLWSRHEPVSEPVPKPVSSDLPPETVAQVIATLTTAMATERLFLDAELTVDRVGKHTHLSPKHISAVLNQHMQQNFNAFVNTYRVEEVKCRLTDPAYTHFTLTGIAFDCGFNSQATFQRAFRQRVGVSPTEYIAQQTKNTAQIRI